MRDLGALLWVVLVVVGVVSSIISNARRQSARPQATPQRRQVSTPPQARPAPQPPRRQPAPAQPPSTSRVVSSPMAVSARPDVFVSHERARPNKSAVAHLFRDRRSLVRAIIASEVLGKPRALRDE